VKRLGLARSLDDPLCQAVRDAGWEPAPVFLTGMAATLAPPPVERPDAVLVLSPAAARLGLIPGDALCLAQGEATARALGARRVRVSTEPRAEGLADLLREQFPEGGTFLLARGGRSREFLEGVFAATPWRLVPWTTHREAPLEPQPALPVLDAVLAMSPLQAELLGSRSGAARRFAWGERTFRAFQAAGFPGYAWCAPEPAALRRLLAGEAFV
jgi:uroporphyrinogen-III synthase